MKKLTETLDLNHTCGYITLIKTGNPNNNFTQLSKQSNHTIHNGNLFGRHTNFKPSVVGESVCPTNGLSNSMSAEVLTSELDSLNTSFSTNANIDLSQPATSRADSCKLVLDLKSEDSAGGLDEDWCLLELSYGIPLFNADLNQQVCEAVADHQLYNEQR